MIQDYPLAVISNSIGILSETFIYRHMAELLPGKTIVVAREKPPHLNEEVIPFPFLIIDPSKRDWHWFCRGSLYLLKINSLSPVQTQVERYLKKNGVQVILSEYLDHSLRWLGVARKLDIRFFAHAHGYDISKNLRDPVLCQKYLRLNEADGVITMSQYSRKKLINIGLDAAKIHVIPYGINVPDTPITQKTNKTIRCLAVGRMVAKKSPLITLNAFRLALADNPQIHLDYVGEGELFNSAKKYVIDHDLSKKVTLYGGQPNSFVQGLMKNANIFIQHSCTDPITGDEEGLPVAILEAMANSLPVISTRHAGIPEAVTEGITGFLVDEGDVEGMASQIIQLIEKQEVRNKLGKAGWKRVKQTFSWEQERASLLKILAL